MENRRLFIAVNFTSELKKSIAVMQNELRKQISNVKWVEEGNFHLTLKFLGDVPANELNKISNVIKESIQGFRPFLVTMKELGVFPKSNQAKVIWLGVKEGKESLLDLSRRIESALAEVGFPKENKPYKPHLTLGRCRVPQTIDPHTINCDFVGGSKVDSIEVMMSELTQKGPKYTMLTSLRFQ